jgi:primosomal protein N' (replication factor Y)
VLIQTHHPDHPLIRSLATTGYEAVCAQLLEERRAVGLPPYTYLALIRAEAVSATAPFRFLESVKSIAPVRGQEVEIYGPMPAPMVRRAGRHRAQLLLQSRRRQALHAFLQTWVPAVEGHSSTRGVRWSIDIDPLEMY